MTNRVTAKFPDSVCFPEPLGCFALSAGRAGAREGLVAEEATANDEFEDEFLLSSLEFAAKLRAQDPPGCFLCIADTLGDDE
jgi:hypothetical protein